MSDETQELKAEFVKDQISTNKALKDANDGFTKDLNTMRETVDAVKGEMDAMTNETVTKMQDALDKQSDEITELKAQNTALEAAINNPSSAGGEADSEEVIAHKAAYDDYIRKGEHGMSMESRKVLDEVEQKALTTGSEASAGRLAPDGYHNEIVKLITEISPIRQVARVLPLGRGALDVPVQTGQVSPAITAENAAANDDSTDLQFILRKITPVTLTSQVAITNEMLQDSVFPMRDFIAQMWAERFARQEAVNFIQGSGDTGAVNGLANTQTGTNSTALAAGATLTGGSGSGAALLRSRTIKVEDIMNLAYSVSAVYAANGTFAWNRDTTRRIRLLKDGNSQFIFQPGFSGQTGAPGTVLGYSYIECPDIPALGTANIAANTKVGYFGDFRRGYWIADRQGLDVTEDPYSGAGNRRTRFVAHRRVGGSVMDTNALRALSLGAA